MRLVIRTKTALSAIYWVKGNSNSVTGWFAGDAFRKEMNLPKDQHLDCHFSYPKDGNYHLSFKSMNPGFEQYISVYWNKVRVKTITKDEKTDESYDRETFANMPNGILGHLMVAFKPESLAKVENFPFATIGFNIAGGNFLNGEVGIIIAEEDIGKDDFVINATKFDKHSISISARLYRCKDNIATASTTSDPIMLSKTLEINKDLNIDLLCHAAINEGI